MALTPSAITPPKVIRRDQHSSDGLRSSLNFVFFCRANNARFHRFPVGQTLLHLNTTTSIGEAVKTIGTEFWKFHCKGSFSKKNAKIANKISGCRIEGKRKKRKRTKGKRKNGKRKNGKPKCT